MVISAAMRVHIELGPGMLEVAYRSCLAYELRCGGFEVREEMPLPLTYRGVRLPTGYRVDLLVADLVLVEVKSVAGIMPVHKAQLLSYLRMSGHELGLILNFGSHRLKDGIKRIVNDRPRRTSAVH